jgi:dihydroneopterin aldolase
LAQDIAAVVLGEFEVSKIRVEIEKFILPETDWVGVILERSSSEIN